MWERMARYGTVGTVGTVGATAPRNVTSGGPV